MLKCTATTVFSIICSDRTAAVGTLPLYYALLCVVRESIFRYYIRRFSIYTVQFQIWNYIYGCNICRPLIRLMEWDGTAS